MRYGKMWTLIALGVAACTSSDRILGTPMFEAVDESLPVGVHARLETGLYGSGRQTVYVVLHASEVDFSSYQGVVDFDHQALRLISVSAPKTDTHLFNREEAAERGLPIAGFAVDGFDEPVVITLSFSSPRALRTGDLTAHLDVVATSVGAEIPPTQIFESHELIPEGRP